MTPDWHPPRFDLVRNRTKIDVNRSIDRQTQGMLAEIGSEPHAIRNRLWELDREWHVDRALYAVFAVLGSFTAQRAFRAVRRGHALSGWRLLFWTQVGIMAYHAIRGWSPPVSLFRRLGFRTEKEIGAERTALEKRLATSTGI